MTPEYFFVVLSIYFYDGKRPQKLRGILEFISVRENNQKPRQSPQVHTCEATSG
jgi:hypothetical protein